MRFLRNRRRCWADWAAWSVVAVMGLLGVVVSALVFDDALALLAISAVFLLLAAIGLVYGWGMIIPFTLFGMVGYSMVAPAINEIQVFLTGALIGAGLGGAVEAMRSTAMAANTGQRQGAVVEAPASPPQRGDDS